MTSFSPVTHSYLDPIIVGDLEFSNRDIGEASMFSVAFRTFNPHYPLIYIETRMEPEYEDKIEPPTDRDIGSLRASGFTFEQVTDDRKLLVPHAMAEVLKWTEKLKGRVSVFQGELDMNLWEKMAKRNNIKLPRRLYATLDMRTLAAAPFLFNGQDLPMTEAGTLDIDTKYIFELIGYKDSRKEGHNALYDATVTQAGLFKLVTGWNLFEDLYAELDFVTRSVEAYRKRVENGERNLIMTTLLSR